LEVGVTGVDVVRDKEANDPRRRDRRVVVFEARAGVRRSDAGPGRTLERAVVAVEVVAKPVVLSAKGGVRDIVARQVRHLVEREQRGAGGAPTHAEGGDREEPARLMRHTLGAYNRMPAARQAEAPRQCAR
jgi:hypothetical protein